MDELDKKLKQWGQVRSRDLRDADPLLRGIRKGIEFPEPRTTRIQSWHVFTAVAVLWIGLIGASMLLSYFQEIRNQWANAGAPTPLNTGPAQIWIPTSNGQLAIPMDSGESEPLVDLEDYAGLVGGLE